MGHRESRDANDPRDELRAMNKAAREAFEQEEMDDTGGPAHRREQDRDGVPAERRAVEGASHDATATPEQDETARRVPDDEATTAGGAEREASAPAQPASADPREP